MGESSKVQVMIMKNKIPKLSLCMIVKNEEDVLARCLKSVKSIVGEIIIVDTGSTDKTPEIAKEFGATILHHEWGDDFCSARNYSLDHVTGEWVLVLDADEVLIYDSSEQIARLLTDNQAEGYFIRVVNLLGDPPDLETSDDMVVRLFRNRPEYRFEGVIHEQIKSSIYQASGEHALKRVPLTIYHDGYLAENIKKKEKVKRNSRVISKALGDTPDNPFLLYSLGCECFIAENFQTAANMFNKALDLIPVNEGYLPDLIIKTGLCLYKLGHQTDMRELINRYQAISPLSPELLFLSGLANLDNGNLVQAERDIKDCMHRLPVVSAGHLPFKENQLYQALGDIHTAKEAWNEALYFYFLALKAKPNSLFPIYKITDICREQHPDRQIEEFLSFCPPETKCSLLTRLLKSKDTEAATFLILGLCRDIIISDLDIAQILVPQALSVLNGQNDANGYRSNDWRLNTAICLAKAFLHISGYKTGEAGNSSGICERLWQNIKQILFAKGAFK